MDPDPPQPYHDPDGPGTRPMGVEHCEGCLAIASAGDKIGIEFFASHVLVRCNVIPITSVVAGIEYENGSPSDF